MYRRAERKTKYQLTTYVAVVVLLLIMFTSAVYFFMVPDPAIQVQKDELLQELESNRRLWESRRPVSFRYVVDRICSCPPEDSAPYIVTNERGQRTAVFPRPVESASGELLTGPPSPVGIEDLFGLIEQGVVEGEAVRVDYHYSFGYAATSAIGPDRYEIRDFETIEYRDVDPGRRDD